MFLPQEECDLTVVVYGWDLWAIAKKQKIASLILLTVYLFTYYLNKLSYYKIIIALAIIGIIICLNVTFFSMKEICDVYVRRHGDGVGGASLLWPVTLTERYEPIRIQLCCRTDVTVKEKITVTRLPKLYNCKEIRVRLNTSVVLIKIHGGVFFCPALSTIVHRNWSNDLKSSTNRPEIHFLGGVSLPVWIGMVSNCGVSECSYLNVTPPPW